MSNPPVTLPSPTGGPVGPSPSAAPVHAVREQVRSGDAPPASFALPETEPARRSVERVPDTGPTKVVRTPPSSNGPATASRPATVRDAIADAARRTSVDYEYLVAQAELESGLNPHAKASTSTATGLFQFLETTWLATVKKHGPRFGYDGIASQIDIFSNGRPFVADSAQRNAILALRTDPQMASLMAAGFAEDNREKLAPVLGRQPDHSELYLAHFLGAGGARKFLTAMQQNPGQSAASVFPQAAAANRPIFYENGQPRSLAGVMNLIQSKMSRALARVESGASNSFADAGFAPAQLAAMAAGRGATSAGYSSPYGIETAAGFEPAIYAGAAPTVLSAPAQAASPRGAAAALPRPSVSMSAMLRATFGGDGAAPLATPEGAAQVKRAYDQLKAFGI